ncbi:MAG: hypothetical protein P8Q99_09140 [Paracoccaceae bacterium]|nr:hypothetical protein [Paracoccaceae bacterium]
MSNDNKISESAKAAAIRETRLKQALKANMARRKAQAKARKSTNSKEQD